MSRLLVCDLDGTLLGEAAPLRTLLDLLRKPQAPILAFATGRQGFSAMALLSKWDVKQGTYLIAGVGTEMYRRIGTRWMPIAAWPELHAPWDGYSIRRTLGGLRDLRPQRIPAASAYKVSYFAPAQVVPEVGKTLKDAGIDATIVHSHGDMLDVLPGGIDKGCATAWLARRMNVRFNDMITCGNTANDISMLGLPCPSVVVGSCDAELREAAASLPETFVANQPCAGGIIEGLRFFGWLSDGEWK